MKSKVSPILAHHSSATKLREEPLPTFQIALVVIAVTMIVPMVMPVVIVVVAVLVLAGFLGAYALLMTVAVSFAIAISVPVALAVAVSLAVPFIVILDVVLILILTPVSSNSLFPNSRPMRSRIFPQFQLLPCSIVEREFWLIPISVKPWRQQSQRAALGRWS